MGYHPLLHDAPPFTPSSLLTLFFLTLESLKSGRHIHFPLIPINIQTPSLGNGNESKRCHPSPSPVLGLLLLQLLHPVLSYDWHDPGLLLILLLASSPTQCEPSPTSSTRPEIASRMSRGGWKPAMPALGCGAPLSNFLRHFRA